MKSLLPLAVLALAAFSVPAAAEMDGPHQGPRRMLERLDTNKDGAVDKAEMRAAQEERWSRLDPSGSGSIALSDMPAAMERIRDDERRRMANERFKAMDANSDGRLSRDEFLSSRDERFEHMDRNDDGRIDRADMQAMREDRKSR